MTIMVSVSEAKARLSELLNKVIYGGDRIILTKHGKPVAEITLPREAAESGRDSDDWVWRVAGALKDDVEFGEIMDDVIASRRGRMPREVPPI
jgi:prevent-host-death family protein